jgi:hypothetical protein
MNATIQDLFDITDDGDEWGHNREMAWGIAFTLYLRDESMPSAWRFEPGMGITESNTRNECFAADELLTYYDEGTITGDDLRAFGNMLNEQAETLEAAGKSY